MTADNKIAFLAMISEAVEYACRKHPEEFTNLFHNGTPDWSDELGSAERIVRIDTANEAKNKLQEENDKNESKGIFNGMTILNEELEEAKSAMAQRDYVAALNELAHVAAVVVRMMSVANRERIRKASIKPKA